MASASELCERPLWGTFPDWLDLAKTDVGRCFPDILGRFLLL
jgi:hypothetical protein